MANSSLEVRLGFATEQGKRDANEDYVGAKLPSSQQRELKGVVIAVADGIGGYLGGRQAAEVSVRCFIDGYYGLPDTLGVERAAGRALAAVNRWVHTQGRHDSRLAHMGTTFSTLILRGRQAHILHVGDTRIYRLRQNKLTCLTIDHTLKQPSMNHVLYRAVGLEEDVRVDYASHHLETYDRYLLCSDGVHGTLNNVRIAALMAQQGAPEEVAQSITQAALQAGSNDNITALIADVVELPPLQQADIKIEFDALPIQDLPKLGDFVDGFQLIEIISDGRYSRVFKAQDTRELREVAVKFPHPRIISEDAYRRAFVREAWVAAHARSPWVAEVVKLAAGRQTRLYSVMPYYHGITLEQRLSNGVKVELKEGCDVGIKLAKAVYALHKVQIIHRDIKPDNIMLIGTDGLKLLDLGVARLPGVDRVHVEDIPGTPSYMAAELFRGEHGDERSDVFALGVTLYRFFTAGRYPYGEIEPFTSPRFNRYSPLSEHRPDLPLWLDATLKQALLVDKEKRYADSMELAFDLETGLAHGVNTTPTTASFYERNPLIFWQVLCGVLAILLMIVIAVR